MVGQVEATRTKVNSRNREGAAAAFVERCGVSGGYKGRRSSGLGLLAVDRGRTRETY